MDWIALSFVRTRTIFYRQKNILNRRAGIFRLSQRLKSLLRLIIFEEIMDNSEGIMVARGDLGLRYPAACAGGAKASYKKSKYP